MRGCDWSISGRLGIVPLLATIAHIVALGVSRGVRAALAFAIALALVPAIQLSAASGVISSARWKQNLSGPVRIWTTSLVTISGLRGVPPTTTQAPQPV